MRLLAALLLLFAVGCTRSGPESPSMPLETLRSKIARFSPTDITADLSRLGPQDRQALDKIIQAARLMDEIYLRQLWSGNPALLKRLQADRTPLGQARYHYFRLNGGPWSRLDRDAAFLDGVPAVKPPQCSFYPEDMTKEEFESWVSQLPREEARQAKGFFHVIRRGPDRQLRAMPYSEEYREFLEPAAQLLREAASLATIPSLRDFLARRADAFLSNEYYSSDVAWLELDSPIDVTIGPYETYDDELFSYKAAFEAFVGLRDDQATASLARFSGHLQEIENRLPLDPRYRNPRVAPSAPIRVIDLVFNAGQARPGVQTAAFNLPNDERILREKGARSVLLKNVQRAKFDKILTPIAAVVLAPEDRGRISFEAFFSHILTHELTHGLGPHTLKLAGKDTTVRHELKELHAALEEAKADAAGLFALQLLIDRGVADKAIQATLYTTYLASMFRSLRFGIQEAHAKGVALQLHYLLEEGVVKSTGAGEFGLEPTKIKDGIRKLTGLILAIQAEGSYPKAKALLEKYGSIRPEVQAALDRLGAVPVDIEPRFTAAEKP